jgi:hypothetical protein
MPLAPEDRAAENGADRQPDQGQAPTLIAESLQGITARLASREGHARRLATRLIDFG